MEDANTADVLYLDFAKAFDSVQHRFLLAKLESFGLCNKIVRWIRSYLTGRTYRAQVADVLLQEPLFYSASATWLEMSAGTYSALSERVLLFNTSR